MNEMFSASVVPNGSGHTTEILVEAENERVLKSQVRKRIVAYMEVRPSKPSVEDAFKWTTEGLFYRHSATWRFAPAVFDVKDIDFFSELSKEFKLFVQVHIDVPGEEKSINIIHGKCQVFC